MSKGASPVRFTSTATAEPCPSAGATATICRVAMTRAGPSCCWTETCWYGAGQAVTSGEDPDDMIQTLESVRSMPVGGWWAILWLSAKSTGRRGDLTDVSSGKSSNETASGMQWDY